MSCKKKRPNPPTKEEYREAVMQTALNFSPCIYTCKKCRWPVAHGYICGYCGTDSPNEDEED